MHALQALKPADGSVGAHRCLPPNAVVASDDTDVRAQYSVSAEFNAIIQWFRDLQHGLESGRRQNPGGSARIPPGGGGGFPHRVTALNFVAVLGVFLRLTAP